MTGQLDYATISEIFGRFHAAEPEPRGELAHSNAFTLLVAVALSAQATDKGVNRATEALFPVADTPAKMLALGEDGLIGHIRTIGLYRNKARHVVNAVGASWSRSTAARCGRPRGAAFAPRRWTQDRLRRPRGTAFGSRGITVDTHVFRVAHRA